MRKAYLDRSEITILNFYLSERGIWFCEAMINNTGWICNVPVSHVEIR